ALDELADLTADGDESLQQVRIAGALLAGEEFDHGDRFAGHANSEAAAAGQARNLGIAPARKIEVIVEVFDPGGLAGGPDAARQPDRRREAHGPARFGKSLQFGRGTMPDILAAQFRR